MTRPISVPAPIGTDSDAARITLTKALLGAARFLNVSQVELSEIIGVSTATVSRMTSERCLLQSDRKEWQLAVLFVRLFRSLDSITGGRDDISRQWLRSYNQALAAKPVDLLTNIETLVRVVQYLDASRAAV